MLEKYYAVFAILSSSSEKYSNQYLKAAELEKFVLELDKVSKDDYQILLILSTKPGITSSQSISAGDSNTSIFCPGR